MTVGKHHHFEGGEEFRRDAWRKDLRHGRQLNRRVFIGNAKYPTDPFVDAEHNNAGRQAGGCLVSGRVDSNRRPSHGLMSRRAHFAQFAVIGYAILGNLEGVVDVIT